MGVRYVVVVEQRAPEPFERDHVEAPRDLSESLTAQLDLEQLAVNPALAVYRNTAWAPSRTVLPDDAREASIEDDGDALSRMNEVEFSDSEPVLTGELDFAQYGGEVPDDSLAYLAAAPSQNWKLEVDGEEVPSTPRSAGPTPSRWAAADRPPSATRPRSSATWCCSSRRPCGGSPSLSFSAGVCERW